MFVLRRSAFSPPMAKMGLVNAQSVFDNFGVLYLFWKMAVIGESRAAGEVVINSRTPLSFSINLGIVCTAYCSASNELLKTRRRPFIRRTSEAVTNCVSIIVCGNLSAMQATKQSWHSSPNLVSIQIKKKKSLLFLCQKTLLRVFKTGKTHSFFPVF